MSAAIRRLLLDALKPRELSIIELSRALGSLRGVEEVNIVVSEVDSRTETIKVMISGPGIDYSEVTRIMEKHAVSVRGVDEISVTKTKPH